MSMKYFTKPVMAIALLMAGVQASQGDVANVPPGIHVARPPLLNYVLKPNVSDATFEDLFLSATVKNPNSSPQSYTPVFTGLYNRCKEITNKCSSTVVNGSICFEDCTFWIIQPVTIKGQPFTVPAKGMHYLRMSIPGGEQPHRHRMQPIGDSYISPVTLDVGGTKVNIHPTTSSPR